MNTGFDKLPWTSLLACFGALATASAMGAGTRDGSKFDDSYYSGSMDLSSSNSYINAYIKFTSTPLSRDSRRLTTLETREAIIATT